MADQSGQLTPEDRVVVERWFAQHWKNPVECPVCKTSGWTFGNHVVQMTRYATDAFQSGSTVFPYLPVSCTTCAHTIFFGAATIGIGMAPPQPTLLPPLPPLRTPNVFNPLLAPRKAP